MPEKRAGGDKNGDRRRKRRRVSPEIARQREADWVEVRQEALDEVNERLGTDLSLNDFRRVEAYPTELLRLIGDDQGDAVSVRPPLDTGFPEGSTEFELLRQYQECIAFGALPDARQAKRLRFALLECTKLVKHRLDGLESEIRTIIFNALRGDPRKVSRQWSELERCYADVHASRWAKDVCPSLVDDVRGFADKRIELFKKAFGLESMEETSVAKSETGNFERGYREHFAKSVQEYLATTRPDLSEEAVVVTIASLWLATEMRITDTISEDQTNQIGREVKQALGILAPRKRRQKKSPPA